MNSSKKHDTKWTTPLGAAEPMGQDRLTIEARDILCADEVAAWLRVDRKTVYNAVRRDQLPCQRLGKRLLFSRIALERWMGSSGITPDGTPA